MTQLPDINGKMLIYAIAVMALFACDDAKSAAVKEIVMVWLTQGICDACVYKVLHNMVGGDFEYDLRTGDNFSIYLTTKLKNGLKVKFAPCGGDDTEQNLMVLEDEDLSLFKLHFVRRWRSHGALYTNEVDYARFVEIRDDTIGRLISFRLTQRQVESFLSLMDMHAHVLRAHRWNSSGRALREWLASRCINLSSPTNDLKRYMIPDLILAMRDKALLHCAVCTLAPLALTGKLPKFLSICNCLRVCSKLRAPNKEIRPKILKFLKWRVILIE